MTTITINWLWLGGLVLFIVVGGIIQRLVDEGLGVTDRLMDLPSWKRVCHETMYVFWGVLLYVLFLK